MSSREKKNKHTGQTSPDNIYVNRELSWLEFNRRVLLEAADPQVPLLERLKFLMIYQSNLEEFYRVRIGILTHRAMLTPDSGDPVSGMRHPDPPGYADAGQRGSGFRHAAGSPDYSRPADYPGAADPDGKYLEGHPG